MPVDPFSLLFETTIGLELKLISQLKLKDFWLIHKFEKHITDGRSPELILDDISDIKSRIILAINNSDEKEKDAWIGLLLSKLDVIKEYERFGLCFVLEEIMINYSKSPNFIESDIFKIYAWFCKYYKDWEIKYPQEYLGNEFVVFKDMINFKITVNGCLEIYDDDTYLKGKFCDPSFLSAWACAQMLYRCSLNMAELSQENLIRVGNHLSHFSAGMPVSAFRKNVIFDVIYLEILIQIAAKAKTLQIEPMHSKLKNIVIQTNYGRINVAFKSLEGVYKNNIAKLGNIEVFLATPAEIQKFKEEIIGEQSQLENVLP
jgi:hypothetical protein